MDMSKHLHAKGWVITQSGCWEWLGSRLPAGYGTVSVERKNIYAHRAAYETWVEPIKPGNVVRHYVCDNPPCINPEHLRQGTPKDNTQDMLRKGRHEHGADHHWAKLTEAEVADILEEYPKGVLTQVMLGEVYGVNFRTISAITRGENWGSLDG